MNSKKVFDYIDRKRDELANLLSLLIQKNSLNLGYPDTGEELEAQEFLASELEKIGLEVSLKAFDKDEKRPNVTGILKGNGGGKDLILTGHVDVVPIGEPEKWSVPPFGGVIKNGRVYGRGANDMKGGLSAAYLALKAIKECGVQLNGDVYYMSTVGEESQEGETIGAAAAVDREYNSPFAIVCEASDMEVHSVSSGLFFFNITIPGKAIHTSKRNLAVFPQNYGLPTGSDIGVDALQKALPFINFFYRLEQEWNLRFKDEVLGSGGQPIHDQQGVGIYTINPSFIEGGTYFGSMMPSIKITYCVWYPEFVDKKELFDEIRSKVEAIAFTDDWLKKNPPVLELGVIQDWEGFNTDLNHPGVVALRESLNKVTGEDGVISGHKAVTDASFISKKQIPVTIFGAGTMKNMSHGVDEFAVIDDLIIASKTYAQMIMEWCG